MSKTAVTVVTLPEVISPSNFQSYLHEVKHNLNHYLVNNKSIPERRPDDEKKARQAAREPGEKVITYTLEEATTNYLALERLLPEFISRCTGGKASHLDESQMPPRGKPLNECRTLSDYNATFEQLTTQLQHATNNLPVVSNEKNYHEAIALLAMLSLFARLEDIRTNHTNYLGKKIPGVTALEVKTTASNLRYQIIQNIAEYAQSQNYNIQEQIANACPIETEVSSRCTLS
jgi:hypothetical protein